MSTGTVHYWINAGDLPARRGPGGRWALPFPPETEATCRVRATSSSHQHPDIGPTPPGADEYPVTEVARRVGVKPDVIYARAEWGHIPSRRGPGNRVWIRFTPDVEAACLRRITNSYKLPDAVKTQAAQRLERIAV